MPRHTRTTVLIVAADAALRLSSMSRNDRVMLLGRVETNYSIDAFSPELAPGLPTFRGKPKVAASGAVHEKKRIEREQRKQHGQKMRGR